PTDARAYGSLPLVFEPNRGQSDAPVRYLARGAGYRMLFTAQSALITLRAGEESTATIGIRYVGANSRPRVVGEAGLPGASNYFRGRNESAYLTDVPHYAKVRYSNLYPGIDLIYYGNQRTLEYDFVVAPGADPSRIRLAFDGARTLAIDDDGNLLIDTPAGAIKQHKPD